MPPTEPETNSAPAPVLALDSLIKLYLYPKTLREYFRFYILGQATILSCNKLNLLGGAVECLFNDAPDKALLIPMGRIMQVLWEKGYQAAIKEAVEKIASQNISRAHKPGTDQIIPIFLDSSLQNITPTKDSATEGTPPGYG